MSFKKDDIVYVGEKAYRLEDRLGQGGMATVWLARAIHLNSLVVIKILDPGSGPSVTRWFQVEARALAQLGGGDFLPVVTDLGVTTGKPEAHYYIMERIRGSSLKECVDHRQAKHKTRALPVSTALNITAQVAQGLARVHRKGIVHCDIKPQNLMLYQYEDEDGVARSRTKIIDFGILWALDDERPREGYAGTAVYSSGEQLIGQKPTGAADVFALGVVTYELLAGARPYVGFGMKYEEQVKRGDLPAPLLSTVGEFPADVTALVARMLDVDPTQRPSALEVADESRRILREADAGPKQPMTNPGRRSGDDDRQPISIAEIDSTDVDPDQEQLMSALAAGAAHTLGDEDTEPAPIPTPQDGGHTNASAIVVHAQTTPLGAARGMRAAPKPTKIQHTVPMPKRPAASDAVTLPPTSALPPPASDRRVPYVTPAAPSSKKEETKRLEITPRATPVAKKRPTLRRRFGGTVLVIGAGLLGAAIVLAALSALGVLGPPARAPLPAASASASASGATR